MAAGPFHGTPLPRCCPPGYQVAHSGQLPCVFAVLTRDAANELILSGQGTWDGPRAPGVLGSRLCAAVLSADAPVCVLQVE